MHIAVNERLAPDLGRAAPEHSVHFYESEEGLSEVVVDYLEDGLVAGDDLLLVATAAHQRLFAETLAARGFDVEAAIDSGRLSMLDAHEMIVQLMDGPLPAADRFHTLVGSLVKAREDSARPARLRAYGEMVDLLWKEGRAGAALRLEELWGELQQRHDFSLLCAYARTEAQASTDGLRQICGAHDQILGSQGRRTPPPSPQHRGPEALVADLERRRSVEQALRDSVLELRVTQDELRRSHDDLQDLVEHAPFGLHWVDSTGIILGVNQAELELLGYRRDEYVGQPSATFHADPDVASEIMARLHQHEVVRNVDAKLVARDGSCKQVLLSATGIWHHQTLSRARFFVLDVTERHLLQQARESASSRNERLMRITAAIADAVTPDQVHEAVVDQVAAALGASTAGLWLVRPDGRTADLVRSIGYSEAGRSASASLDLESPYRMPVIDALRDGSAVWLGSRAELLAQYPHLAHLVTAGSSYRVSCLPMMADGRQLGCLAFTFEGPPVVHVEQRYFKLLIARYAGQALERLRLLDAERESRARAEAARHRAELLYGLARALNEAETAEQVFAAALDALERALAVPRSAILAFDAEGVMRFRAWRGLSDAYRQAVEGHSPWSRQTRQPQPLLVADVEQDEALAPFLPVFRSEGIAAVAFFPLVASGRLIGKFMIYDERPRALTASELDVARAIGDHAASAVARFASIEELQRTVRFNEMFAGLLGHDLRNPLAAIMTSGQLALRRGPAERLTRPLSRILSSGERMARMIDQLLDFTRIRVGSGLRIEPRQIDLVPLLRQVIDDLRAADPRPPQAVRLEDTGSAVGHWDADRLTQVFGSLIANALQHGQSEQGVTVRIDGQEGDRVRVEVHNLGAISPGPIPRLFDPMTSHERRRDRSQGLGLGLYIARQIVQAHQGEIEVRSDEASGTVFAIQLPRHPGSPPAQA